MKTTDSTPPRLSLTVARLLLLAAWGGGCGRAGGPAVTDAPARRLAVRAQPAAIRVFERRITVQGTLEAKRSANVAARTDGNLDAIWVDVGDAVVAGETPLFQIDPVSRQNAVAIAEQDLAVARAAQVVAQAQARKAAAEARKAALDFQRFARLRGQEQVSQHEYEEAEVRNEQASAAVDVVAAQADLAERQVRQAEAALAIARKNLDDTRILAPLSGVVSARLAEPGEQMAVGRVLLRIEDLSSVEAAAFLPARYHAEIRAGETRFRLGVHGRDAGLHTLTTRDPTINPVLRTFEVRGLLQDAPEQAVPGAMAELTILFESRRNIGVPASAVLDRGGRARLFVVENGRAVARNVETGWRNDGWIEILSGLEADAAVVTEGQTQLADGGAVDVL